LLQQRTKASDRHDKIEKMKDLLQSSYHQSYASFGDTSSSSLSLNADDIAPDEPVILRHRSFRSSPWSLASVVLLSFAFLASTMVVPYFRDLPTAIERELADAYELGSTSDTWKKIRSAQAIADQALSAKIVNLNHFRVDRKEASKYVRDIREEGADDYMKVPDGCEATVMLLRHCEKGNVREHCEYMGYERSVYLASLFGDNHERWPAPSYIFAQSPKGRHNEQKMNFREIETVGPLADKFGIAIDDSYTSENIADLTKEILTFLKTGNMCGKLTVVNWKHSEIPRLAHRLGCGPMQGCPVDYKGSSFDNVWQIKFVYRTMDNSERKNLELPHNPEWRVYGSEQAEGFDPLAVSKDAGDYKPGGTLRAARWEKSLVAFPERRRPSDTSAWQATHVGFEDQSKHEKHS